MGALPICHSLPTVEENHLPEACLPGFSAGEIARGKISGRSAKVLC
jgi:hypothetical protein